MDQLNFLSLCEEYKAELELNKALKLKLKELQDRGKQIERRLANLDNHFRSERLRRSDLILRGASFDQNDSSLSESVTKWIFDNLNIIVTIQKAIFLKMNLIKFTPKTTDRSPILKNVHKLKNTGFCIHPDIPLSERKNLAKLILLKKIIGKIDATVKVKIYDLNLIVGRHRFSWDKNKGLLLNGEDGRQTLYEIVKFDFSPIISRLKKGLSIDGMMAISDQMSQYKLTYFDVRAIAEPIRMLLHYMGKSFEDVRISFEDWQKVKSSSPFGKLPTLEIDGKMTHQSVAICRYLGKLASLNGADDWEDLQIDIFVDTFQDFRKEISAFHHEKDPTEKENKKKIILDEKIPFYFEKFDSIVKENGGYVANGKLSWGDFYIAAFSESLHTILAVNVIDNYPNLKEWRNKFFEIPQVKDWIAKRPNSIL